MTEKENHKFTGHSNGDDAFLFGHGEQIAFLLNCIRTNQIPNAWLFHGPAGIGKASLALNVAKVLSNNTVFKEDSLSYLSEKDLRHPNASYHVTNIFFCKRKWDDKKKLFQKNISIDDIRELGRKFYLSSTDYSYKVCIVDTTEDLNISASNSLLKMLEEPPKNTLFILVSNNKQSILPTILSRCQKISFQRLSEDDLQNITEGLFEENHFDLLKRTGALTSCDGSVKKLLTFLDQDYIKFFNSMKELLLDLPNLNKRKAIKLLTGNKEYLGNNDQDKSAFGVLLKLLASLAKDEIDLLIDNKSSKEEINLIAAHLYPQISLLRHQSMEYNVEAKKVLFLALNIIESAFEKYRNNRSVIVDSHCHLDFSTLNNDLSGVLSRAKSEGVHKMLTIGTNYREIKETISLSERFEEIFFATGVHPNQPSDDLKFNSNDLLSICAHKKMIGVGETGLDFHYSQDSKKDQIKSLIQHIEVAKEADLPVIIHARNADKEIGQILSEQFHKSSFKCVMHCFSSGSYLAEKVIDLGFYLSMSGIITFKNSQNLREIFAKVPIDKVLVETDSPFLAPVPHRGKSNEPAFVSFIAKKGAEVLDVDEDFFRTQTTKNFFTLFKKAF